MTGPDARPDVVLGSASTRRKALLERLGVSFRVVSVDLDESVRDGEPPLAYVRRLSIEKSDAVVAIVGPTATVIAADTTVALGDRILSKPADDDDARAILRALSGRTHEVHTGVTVRRGQDVRTEVVTTRVTFAELSDAVLDWYLGCGEHLDKAGAYGLQGAADAFVDRVDGSVSNVIGLPLPATVRLSRAIGIELLRAD